MTQTLAEMLLPGAKISLIEYPVKQPEVLGRPDVSKEMILQLTREGTPPNSTNPSASWYLTEKHYRGLLSIMRSEDDFYIIADALQGIQGPNDVSKIELLLLEKTIGTQLLVRAYLRRREFMPEVREAFIAELRVHGSVTAFADYYGIQRTYIHRINRKLGIRAADYRL